MTELKKDAPEQKQDLGSAEQKPAAKKDATKTQPAIKVTSTKQGFRRAGFSFGKEAVVIAVTDLTKAQMKQLEDEPCLAVSTATIKVEAA